MALSTLWWLLAGLAVALELLTGTLYLLLIGLAFAAGALAAHLGYGLPVQLLVAAVLGLVSVGLWHLTQSRRAAARPPAANPDMNLDVGELIQVDAWVDDGTAQVRYRGAQWSAVGRPGARLAPGPHRVTEINGNRLVLEAASPANRNE